MPSEVSMIGRTWRQVLLPSMVERLEGTGREGTPGLMWMWDRIQITSVAYLIPWIQNHRGQLESEGIFYETMPECCSALGSY
jgi:hypothetical protein